MNRNESIISAIYAKVGQSKRNNQKVMCHKSMKFSDMFGHNPPHTFDKFRENTFQWKMLSQLDLESKGQSPIPGSKQRSCSFCIVWHFLDSPALVEDFSVICFSEIFWYTSFNLMLQIVNGTNY